MSIAEQIALGSQQQSQNWSVLANSLGSLGQQVGQQLAMREYQKQAQAQLPFIQQTMQDALADAGSGKSAEAFARLLPLVTNPQYTQNPFILPALKSGMEFTEFAAQDAFKRFQTRQQYGGDGVDVNENVLPIMSGAEEAMARMRGEQPNVVTTPPTTATGKPPGQPKAIMQPPGTIVEPELPMGEGGAEGGALTRDQAAQPDAAMEGVGGTEPDAVQIATRDSLNQAMTATPEEQTKALQSTIAGDKETQGWKPLTVEGFSRFFPKENISDTMTIAPVKTQVKFEETWVGETNKPGARFTGKKDFVVDDKMNLHANEYARGLQTDVNLLVNTGPENEDQKWVDLIEEAGGIQNINTSKSGEGTTATYKIKAKGKTAIDANKEVYDAITKIKGFSAIASETGIKILPELETGPGVRERKFGSVEEALASGLPAGSTVYILKDGKYKPARIKE